VTKSIDLLVGNGRFITHNVDEPFLDDGCVAVAGDEIAAVGRTAELRLAHPGARFLDAQRRVIMPGLINAHTHLYSALARGMALKEAAPGNFTQILEQVWWRLDKALTLDDVYLSGMVGMIDCIRNGVTTVFDHHSSPGAVNGSLFRLAEAAQQAGLRSCFCYEVSDRDGDEVAALGIEENRAFLQRCSRSGNNLIGGLFGLHASFTISDQTLDRCRTVASDCGAGFHVHTAEALADVDDCLREHKMRVVERWNAAEILGSTTLAAHCVHVNEHEIDLLRDSRTRVIHNPQSNMNNAVGCAPVLEMMRNGVHVGLGTDGYSADMFESAKAAGLLQKHHCGDPRAACTEPPQMLFAENATIATECFGCPLGKLAPGAQADIILVDYDPPTPLHNENLYGHVLFGFSGRAVATTIIGGQIIMRDRQFVSIDENEVMAKARAAAEELWKRF